MKARSAIIVLIIAVIIGTGIIKYSEKMPKCISNMLELTRLKNKYFGSKTNYDYDLIIVGSGLAGLTSAFEANKLSEGKKKF